MNLKILHIIEGVDRKLGGQPSALFGILGIEKELGIDSEVLSIEKGESSFSKNDFSQKFHLFEESFPYRFSNSTNAINWLKKNIVTYDLIVIHGIWTLLSYRSCIIALNFKKKYIIWPHGSLLPMDMKKKYYLKKIIGPVFLKNILKNSSAICLTSSKEEYLFQRFKASTQNFILPLPVNVPKYESHSIFSKDEKDNFTFLFVGRIDYKKGIDVLIAAFEKVYLKHPNINIDIWGTGDILYTKYINDLIIEKGLESKIALKGFLEAIHKQRIFSSSDCFVLISMFENFGIAPIEALQMGTPVLLSKNVDIWQDVKDAAWVCEYNEESAIKAMEEILTDSKTYQHKKELAIDVGNKFLPEKLMETYRNFYKKMKNK